MICKTCKYWDCLKDNPDYGMCDRIDSSEDLDIPNGRAIIKVSELGMGYLETHMQFGCFLWEKIDNQ